MIADLRARARDIRGMVSAIDGFLCQAERPGLPAEESGRTDLELSQVQVILRQLADRLHRTVDSY